MKRLLLDTRTVRSWAATVWPTTNSESSRNSISAAVRTPRQTRSFAAASSTGGGGDSGSSSAPDFSAYYCVEVSNADRPDATKLTVRGPDVAGMLASMTLSLAREGCSVVELHAQTAASAALTGANLREPDMTSHRTVTGDDQIEDVFYVVHGATGEQFRDHALETLANSLLDSLRTPMNVLSGGGQQAALEKFHRRHDPVPSRDSQITVIKSFEVPHQSHGRRE